MARFKKDSDMNRLDTLVGNDTVFEGTLTSKESICIEGSVKGRIISEGNIVVGENGRVEADVFADTVLIGGEVNGNIVAKTKLEITTHGKLRGDIKTGSLIIAEGVLFEGKCQMITEADQPGNEEEPGTQEETDSR